MSGAEGVLVVNIGVASLFAGGYAIIALTNASQRSALWFTASYLIGMLSPFADLFGPILKAAEVMEVVSYVSFLLATLSISLTFSLFHRRAAPWRAALAILALGLGLRAWIWSEPRDTLTYGMAYQLPFTLAALLAMSTVLAIGRRRPLYLALAGVFYALAANFAVKPFLLVAFGAGATFADYTKTNYALLSQASSGILLLAAGLVLLLIVAQKAITESQLASETDPLSGIANRRGFDRLAQEAMARAARSGLPLSVAMFDLDHFKRVNDTFGHATGDAVIAAFADLLRRTAPGAATVARTGGEEFVMLVEAATAQTAWLAAEAVRIGVVQRLDPELPEMTVSGGVAQLRSGETLAELLRRADQASYAAKSSGRDRICLAELDEVQPVARLHSGRR